MEEVIISAGEVLVTCGQRNTFYLLGKLPQPAKCRAGLFVVKVLAPLRLASGNGKIKLREWDGLPHEGRITLHLEALGKISPELTPEEQRKVQASLPI